MWSLGGPQIQGWNYEITLRALYLFLRRRHMLVSSNKRRCSSSLRSS